MAHERTQPPFRDKAFIPAGYDWPALLTKDGDALEVQYRKTLEHLGRQHGMLGIAFRKAQNKIQDPRNSAGSSRISSTASSGPPSTPT